MLLVNRFFVLSLLAVGTAAASCGDFFEQKGPVFTVENRFTVKHHCVNDEQCADFNVGIQMLTSGGDSVARHDINWDIQRNSLMIIRNDVNRRYEVAMDSLGNRFIETFIQRKRDDPEGFTTGWLTQFVPTTPVNNSKIITTAMRARIALGPTDPFDLLTYATYDVKTGKRLGFKEIVTDSTAVLPMIEAEIRKAEGMSADMPWAMKYMSESLPYPRNIGIADDGLHFTYGQGEVAPNDPKMHELTLSWAQLGTLADRKKWLE